MRKMRSMAEILWLIVDEEINTPEQGAQILNEETQEYARLLDLDETTARAYLMRHLSKLAARATPRHADKLNELFNLTKGDN